MTRPKLLWIYRFLYRLSNLHRVNLIKKLRGRFYRGLLAHAGKNLRISDGVRFHNPSMISIGNNCFIGVGSNFYAWNERIIIGNNVMIAAGVRMITRKHGFADLQIPMTEQGYTNAPIFIEDNVWIGFNAILLPGIRVGEGSIIGAGAIVTRDVEDHTIVGGIPARLIRHRFPKGK